MGLVTPSGMSSERTTSAVLRKSSNSEARPSQTFALVASSRAGGAATPLPERTRISAQSDEQSLDIAMSSSERSGHDVGRRHLPKGLDLCAFPRRVASQLAGEEIGRSRGHLDGCPRVQEERPRAASE